MNIVFESKLEIIESYYIIRVPIAVSEKLPSRGMVMIEDFMKAIHEGGVKRQRRIEIACSKLQKGDTRPCCFDRTRCTIMDVSKSGVLLD